MKLNNKGFAITSVLYGLLILFVSLVGTYLTILVSKMNRLNNISEDINNEYGFKKESEPNENITSTYEVEYTGKYIFTIIEQMSGQRKTCTSYLSNGFDIKYNSGMVNITFIESDCNVINSDNNISSLTLKEIYYNGDDTSE